MIEHLEENITKKNNVFNIELETLQVEQELKTILGKVIKTVESVYFADKFLYDSKTHNSASFSLSGQDFLLCNIYKSVMINNSINMLLCRVRDIDFIIAQHVTSCDFVYFPKFNFYHPVSHSTKDSSNEFLKILLKAIKNKKINIFNRSFIKGILVSHGRPYHFFYDTAIMVEYLYQRELLDTYNHYQVKNSDFLDFSSLYEVKEFSNKVLSPKEINDLTENTSDIFFKVGVKYNHTNNSHKQLALSFDRRVNKYAKGKVQELKLAEDIDLLRKGSNFVLWFGICSEKRSLENQVQLLLSLVAQLSFYHKVVVVVDGWTAPNTKSSNDIKNIEEDYKVFDIIKREIGDIQLISLIGSQSIHKIKVSQYVDFHVSSGATGSIWSSRFAKKPGVLHISQAFYPRMFEHLHYNSLDFPNRLVVDNIEKVKRVDFVSYKINKDDFLNFINTNYPNIFNADCKLDRFKILSNANIDCIDKQKNTYSSVNNDPQIYLNVDGLVDLEYPYTLNIVVYISYDSNIGNKALTFYLNYGDGFNSNDIVSLSTESFSDRAEVNILIEKPLIGIRFDPINAEVDFQLKGLFYKIKKVL